MNALKDTYICRKAIFFIEKKNNGRIFQQQSILIDRMMKSQVLKKVYRNELQTK